MKCGHIVIDANLAKHQHEGMRDAATTRRVVFVTYDGFQSLDLAGPFEAFAGLNELLAAGHHAGPRYRLDVAAVRSGPIRSESGLTIMAETTLAHVRGPLDTLVVVGGRAASQAEPDPALIRQIQRLARRSDRVVSVCTGSFLLAEAGLLDGRTVCTHWARAKLFAKRFPTVTLDGDSLHRRDGNVWTSAGVTAGIDLALTLIADDHGSAFAQVVSRWLVMFYRRPGGQSQFAAPVWHGVSERETIRAIQDQVVAKPGNDYRLVTMAEAASMSERNFLRVFTREVGVTPTKFVESVRLNVACVLLETTDAGVASIARTTGFGTAETMRRTFFREKGVAPSDYRSRFARTAS